MLQDRFLLVAGMILAIGCAKSSTPLSQISPTDTSVSNYLLHDEPAGAKSVTEVKASAKDGEEVTLVGRIGGSSSPFVAGRASFTIVDTSLTPCNEQEGCPTPWDYCCASDGLTAGTAVVKLVEADGKTLAKDAKQDLGMKELQTVVVKGTAKKDDAGNLIVLAPALFIRK